MLVLTFLKAFTISSSHVQSGASSIFYFVTLVGFCKREEKERERERERERVSSAIIRFERKHHTGFE